MWSPQPLTFLQASAHGEVAARPARDADIAEYSSHHDLTVCRSIDSLSEDVVRATLTMVDSALGSLVAGMLRVELSETIPIGEAASPDDYSPISPLVPLQPYRSLSQIPKRGNFGAVHAFAHPADGRLFARKTLRASSECRTRAIMTEFLAARRLMDEAKADTTVWDHVVEVVEAVITTEECVVTCVIDMELMDRGTVDELVGSLRQQLSAPALDAVLASVAKQMLLGLQTLHTRARILHRDVKPANVLVDSTGRVKLCDFSVAAIAGMTPIDVDGTGGLTATDQAGSLTYMAPERLRGEAHGPASDVWSLGVTLLELATGEHPFASTFADVPAALGAGCSTDLDSGACTFWRMIARLRHIDGAEACEAAVSATIETALLFHPNVSAGCASFIRQCLMADPAQRAGLHALLNDPWIHAASLVVSLPT